MYKQEKTNSSNFNAQAFFLFTKLSSWIVIPVLIAIFIGKWLDEKYNTEPWLFLISVGIAFTISMIGLIRSSINEMNKVNIKAREDSLGYKIK